MWSFFFQELDYVNKRREGQDMRKSYRVKTEKDFSRVFHQGQSKANRQFVLYFIEKEQPHFRVGLSVGKKVGNAVTRNRVKRMIRQALTELKDQIQAEYDFILIARKPTAEMNQSEIKKSLIHVINLSPLFTRDPLKQKKGQNSEK